MRWPVFILGCFLMVGCKREPTLPPPLPSDIPEIDQADFTLLTPLRPNRQTHLAVDSASNIYFTQEMADGSDVMFIMGSGDATATRLTSANILTAMGEKGTGNIQSIAATGESTIDFFFAGGTNTSAVDCFGRFDRRTNAIHILADTQQLKDATGMGESITLARGSVAFSGGIVWLLIHHTDQAVLCALEPGHIPPEGPAKFGDPVKLSGAAEDLPRMTGDDAQLAPGDQQSVLLLDSLSTALWRIDPTGLAQALQSTVGLPKAVSLPGEDARGTIVMFAPAGNLIEAKVVQRVDPVMVLSHLPSILILRDGKLTDIVRDYLHAPSDYPLYAMQLQQVVYERGWDTWLGYDSAAGQLVRFRIKPKN